MKPGRHKLWTTATASAEKPHLRACDRAGCPHEGEFRAPKSRTDLNNYFWFCLEHVREYNLSWDYYAGMTTEEIEAELRRDTTWQRPTWPLGQTPGTRRVRIDPEHIRDPFGFFDDMGPNPKARPLTPEEEAARALDLTLPVTAPALKRRYKELVKLHHPDANGGDKAAEERFKQINQAYKTLLNSLDA